MLDIWGQAAILTKLMLYVGALGASGLVIVQVAFAQATSSLTPRVRSQAIALAALALVASLMGFMLRGAALTGGADGMTDPEMLSLLWQTPVGDALLYRLAGGALIIVGSLMPRVGQWVAVAG